MLEPGVHLHAEPFYKYPKTLPRRTEAVARVGDCAGNGDYAEASGEVNTVFPYKGWNIHSRKKARFPMYYCIVYRADASEPSFIVDHNDEFPVETRADAVDKAKYAIDQL